MPIRAMSTARRTYPGITDPGILNSRNTLSIGSSIVSGLSSSIADATPR